MKRDSLVALAAAAMLAAVGTLPAQDQDETPDPNRPRDTATESIDRNADPASPSAEDTETGGSNTTEGNAGAVTGKTRSAELPEFLTRLNLTQQQKQEIRNVLSEHDRRAESLWDEFHALHWQAVELEAGLSATQRLSGHDHEAHHARSSAVRQEQVVDQNAAATDREGREQNAADRFEQAKQARDQQQFGSASDRGATTAPANRKQPQSELNIVSLRIGVVQPNGGVREFQLRGSNDDSGDHSGACKVCMSHQRELGQLWNRIHQVHNELVRVESDRIVAVEGRLTSEQIDQLRDSLKSSATEETSAIEQNRTDRAPGTNAITPPATGERGNTSGSEPRRESTEVPEATPADSDQPDNPQE